MILKINRLKGHKINRLKGHKNIRQVVEEITPNGSHKITNLTNLGKGKMTLRPAKDREITNPESAAHLTESDAGEPQSTPALADHTPS